MAERRLWMKAGLSTALLGTTLVMTVSAGAQSPIQLKDVAPPPEDVVVTARPAPTGQEVERQARAITHMVDFYHDPLARFEDPVCPGIMGLPVEVAALMVDRIRTDAARVGAKVANAQACDANIIVAFVRDGASEVRKLLRTNGYLFSGLETADARAVQNETGPVRAWHVTALRTRFGEAETPSLAQGPVKFEGNPGLGPMKVITTPSSDSRVFLASRIDIHYAVVVINLSAIDGVPVLPIADYAAMRALARTRPAQNDSAASTILSLFDPAGAHPLEMTSFDLAYLRSLYDAGSNVPASVKIGGVQRELRREEARALRVPAPRQ